MSCESSLNTVAPSARSRSAALGAVFFAMWIAVAHRYNESSGTLTNRSSLASAQIVAAGVPGLTDSQVIAAVLAIHIPPSVSIRVLAVVPPRNRIFPSDASHTMLALL